MQENDETWVATKDYRASEVGDHRRRAGKELQRGSQEYDGPMRDSAQQIDKDHGWTGARGAGAKGERRPGDDRGAARDEVKEVMFNSGGMKLGMADGCSLCYVRVMIAGQEVTALLDTGASHCFIRADTAERLGLKVREVDEARRIRYASGEVDVENTRRVVDTRVSVRDKDFEVAFEVLKRSAHEVTLGLDFFFRHAPRLLWNKRRVLFEVDGRTIWTPFVDVHGGELLTDTFMDASEAAVAVAAGGLICGLAFEQEDQAEFQYNTAEWQQDDEDGPTRPTVDPEGILTATQRDAVEDLVTEYADLFTDETPKYPPERYFEGHVKFKNPPKYTGARYRMSKEEEQALRCYIQDLLQAGHLEPARRKGCPVFVLRKKCDDPNAHYTKRWRLICDFRKANEQLERPHVFVEDVVEVARWAASKQLFSSADLKSYFYQIRCHGDPVVIDAGRLGSFRFRTLPMGLALSAQVATLLTRDVFSGHEDDTRPYMDDLLMATEMDFEKHLMVLRRFLATCRDHQLVLGGAKCTFFYTKGMTLGFGVSHGMLHVPATRVKQVAGWKLPGDRRAVKRIVGMATFFSPVIRNLAAMTAPLTECTKGRGPFKLTEEAKEAFEELKTVLMRLPFVFGIRPEQPFIIYSDASDFAIGAALCQRRKKTELIELMKQRDKDLEQELAGVEIPPLRDADRIFRVDPDGPEEVDVPVAFMSRKLVAAETRYPAHDRETLGVVEALRKWRHLVLSQAVTVYTDNVPLTFLLTQPKLSKRQLRWLDTLAEFDLQFRYVPGAANVVADAISRVRHYHTVEVLQLGDDEAAGLAKLYWRETHWKKVANAVKGGKQLEGGFEYKMDNKGLLYADGRLCVPKAAKDFKLKVMAQEHDAKLAAHPGVHATYLRLRQNYYWQGMFKDVYKYVTTCDTCQRIKTPKQRKHGAYRPLEVPEERLTHWAWDIVKLRQARLANGKMVNAVLLIVDRLTKYVVLVPILMTAGAEEVAAAFCKHIVCRFGRIKSVVADRDPRWTGRFWKRLQELMGVRLKLSTARHAQTDGQSERFIQQALNCLRAFVGEDDEWPEQLHYVEHAMNSHVRQDTGLSAAQLVFGYNITSPEWKVDGDRKLTPADEFVQRQTAMVARAREALLKGQFDTAERANQTRTIRVFDVGDQVLVDARALKVPTLAGREHDPPKLAVKYSGPFKIVREVVRGNSYEVDLPKSSKAHRVLNVAALKPYKPDEMNRHGQTERQVGNELRRNVHKVISHRLRGGKHQFLVHWKGRHVTTSEWLDMSALIKQTDKGETSYNRQLWEYLKQRPSLRRACGCDPVRSARFSRQGGKSR
eukprot:m.253449 g.253449  ORF g.253449 m.253449 type:complete len:1325 (-) comp26718_c0_seq14:104-4078(-)